MEYKTVKVVDLKGKNVRVMIALRYSKETNTHHYILRSRRLVDFKKRQITEVDNHFTVETFTLLMEVGYMHFLHDPLISNKVLLRELANIKKFAGKAYLAPELR